MGHFDEVRRLVEDGMEGRNMGIPIGFPKLNQHLSIRHSMGYLVGGYTGSGKTSLVDDAFVLNPLEWLMNNQNSGLDLKIFYLSMERKKLFKLAKWISRRMFLDHGGEPITINKLMGWVSPDRRISRTDFNLFSKYEPYIEALMSKITMVEGPQNPMGIKKLIDSYAEANGKKIDDPNNKPNEKNKIYIPNNPKEIVLIIYDHIGLLKRESRGEGKDRMNYSTKKEIIDLASEDARKFRDFYGYSYVMISQFNRDISNPMRLKSGDVQPMLEDFKDTGATQEDADAVLALFDPYRYLQGKDEDVLGYKVNRIRSEHGKKYRSLHILKNSYGSDDIAMGLAFQPQIGHFKEMNKFAKDMTDADYESILKNDYFV